MTAVSMNSDPQTLHPISACRDFTQMDVRPVVAKGTLFSGILHALITAKNRTPGAHKTISSMNRYMCVMHVRGATQPQIEGVAGSGGDLPGAHAPHFAAKNPWVCL